MSKLEKFNCVFVDLDNTLLKVDSLQEEFILLIKSSLICAFKAICILIFKGKISFKHFVYSKVANKKLIFPVRDELTKILKLYKEHGNKVILISASDNDAVRKILSDNGLSIYFNEVYGTEKRNLKGTSKLEKIEEIIKSLNEISDTHKYSLDKSIYCGDSKSDISIWSKVGGGILVGRRTDKLLSKLRLLCDANKEFICVHDDISFFKQTLKAMRIHQWAKNALILVPLLLSFQFVNPVLDIKALFTFLVFSFGASATYILNDLFDLQNDRLHPTKKNRPFASGNLPVSFGLFYSLFVLCFVLVLSYLLSLNDFFIFLFYLIITVSYSIKLKKKAVIDLIVLSLLYTIRIIAGNISCNIEISYWLISFSTMFFLSLAFLKRYTEVAKRADKDSVPGRGYYAGDKNFILSGGIATYICSILIFGLYITSADIVKHYNAPEVLYFAQILLIYLVGNMWFLSNRGQMNDDPVLFFVKDKRCLLTIFLISVVFLIAHYGF